MPKLCRAGSESKIVGDRTVDVLSDHPYGVVLQNAFVFTILEGRVVGKYIKDRDSSWFVNPDDILKGENGINLTITLAAKEPFPPFLVYVETKSKLLYKVWFTIDYDAGGARRLRHELHLCHREKRVA